MAHSSRKTLQQKTRRRQISRLFWVILGILLLIVALAVSFFFLPIFKVKSIALSAGDGTSVLSVNNKSTLTELLNKFYLGKNIFLVNQDEVSGLLKNSSDTIKSAKLQKHFFSRDLVVEPIAYRPVLVACVEDRQFLISCMFAEEDGVFYKESAGEDKDAKDNKVYFAEISPLALTLTDKRMDSFEDRVNIDSLTGTSIYSEAEMKNLLPLLKYFTDEGYSIKKIHIKSLKIVEIETEKYLIRTSLEKGYAETVKDFELFKSSEKTKNVLSNVDLQVLDLSYKDKIFYKLKVIASSTATSSLIEFVGAASGTLPLATTSATVTAEVISR